MILITSSASEWQTTSRRPGRRRPDRHESRFRGRRVEVRDGRRQRVAEYVVASSKATSCLTRFERAFRAFHWNSMRTSLRPRSIVRTRTSTERTKENAARRRRFSEALGSIPRPYASLGTGTGLRHILLRSRRSAGPGVGTLVGIGKSVSNRRGAYRCCSRCAVE